MRKLHFQLNRSQFRKHLHFLRRIIKRYNDISLPNIIPCDTLCTQQIRFIFVIILMQLSETFEMCIQHGSLTLKILHNFNFARSLGFL